jgi:hypothetical protein
MFLCYFSFCVLAPRSKSRRGRTSRRNKSAQSTTTIVDARSALEFRLANRSDMVTFVGKMLLTISSTTAGVYALSLAASNLSNSMTTVLDYYTRWRIVNLRVFAPSQTGTPACFVFAVFDDTNLSDNLPTSQAGVYETRCSALTLTNSGSIVEWKPAKSESLRWFYVVAETSSGALREIVPCALIASMNSSSSIVFEVFYTIQAYGHTL